ncbi:pyrophosphatase [Escherichia coli]|nr:pyrophosphatase [Escherichia coli]HCI5391114.1 DHH family phosphoesterase [Klebsiella pneumoniae]
MSGDFMKIQNYTPSSYSSDDSEEFVYVFGHKNPDSDSICSALVVADWLNHCGCRASAFRLGKLNSETNYILGRAGINAPELLDTSLTDKSVWLVDFTDAEQGPDSLAESNIIGIIDHHRLGTLTTKTVPDIWVRAVGCCATVIHSILLNESNMTLTQPQAILLMGAIMSDTVALSGPTTTLHDRNAVEHLRRIAGVDYHTFVDELLAAKTSLDGGSAADLFQRDAKQYLIKNKVLLVSQIELRQMSDIDPHLPALLRELKTFVTNSVDVAVLILTDITNKYSVIYSSDSQLTGNNTPTELPGMTSRKKEILPWLTEHLSSVER